MRWFQLLLLGLALLLENATALKYEVTGTRKGVPIPKEQIKFAPYQFGRSKNNGPGAVQPAPTKIKKKRANPISSSANWCGAVNHSPTTNKIKSIHSFWQVPGCTKRTGQTYPQAAAVWIGIDGNTWPSALLQSGTVCKIDTSTSATSISLLIHCSRHEAWWQWVPDTAFTISTMPPFFLPSFLPHDQNQHLFPSKFDNVSQDEQVIVNVTSGPTLARKDADWVVERPYYGSSLAGFPRFDTTWFEDSYATRTTGGNLGILGATQYQIPSLCNSTEYDNANSVSFSL
ncbi:uncharacterized protein PODANS_4_9870 [Podospora anserina S mat+]|uniref:Podospora anserina S mat+ genomic DNA chromosome 4, supercontig 3 n=1 Tax=Podospora anserina (strain S / ATCC MYA-4624 / DSM 980 / FGSC 10383) TaxID=515849 RepID=B2AEA4_PODAN|nr:uncharacterized protein PODANS_4_9870 [Podospora anserina S mat+]CAP61770.1 unnamed protein product [Podospora anserina S mat+]CDP28118.1 Putative protein of unknown function [Podospora anserina S mat+]